ncbi:hypothetical protein HDU98_007506 [Podochytrium sp. JEL0797]|nr:hypothetical protein HDU98_007506 [Podochytrium sp. JEL0797]
MVAQQLSREADGDSAIATRQLFKLKKLVRALSLSLIKRTIKRALDSNQGDVVGLILKLKAKEFQSLDGPIQEELSCLFEERVEKWELRELRGKERGEKDSNTSDEESKCDLDFRRDTPTIYACDVGDLLVWACDEDLKTVLDFLVEQVRQPWECTGWREVFEYATRKGDASLVEQAKSILGYGFYDSGFESDGDSEKGSEEGSEDDEFELTTQKDDGLVQTTLLDYWGRVGGGGGPSNLQLGLSNV